MPRASRATPRPRGLAWPVLAALAGAGLAAEARAEPREPAAPTVAVLGPASAPSRHAESAAVRRALVDLAGALGATALGPEVLRDRRDSALPEGAAAEVDRLRAQARGHFLEFRFPEARALLERARRLLVERGADLLGDPELAAVSFDLARVLLDMGLEDRAGELLAELVRTHPEADPEPADYPPGLVAAFGLARERAETERPEAPSASRALELLEALSVDLALVGDLAEDGRGLLVVRLVGLGRARPASPERAEVALGAGESWDEALGPELGRMLAVLAPAPEAAPAPGPGERGSPTGLFVLSTPPEALLALDGLPLELRTPASIAVEPGVHHLRLSREGFRPVELSVRVRPGQTRPVEVALERRVSIVGAWWLWSLVGVAVAAIVAGGAAWAVAASADQPDVSVRVSGP